MPPRIAQHRRAFALRDFKAYDDAPGTFSGYLAVFGNEDLGGDVIDPGAFAKTLNDARERKAAQSSAYLFPILYQHDDKQPCGGFVDAHEDSHGLYVKGQLDLDTQLGRDTYSGLKKGYMSGLSIGYSAIKHKWVGDIRHLQELALYEGSVVTFPMNPAAQVGNVKAATDDDKQAQEARSKKYGIGIKDGGNVTKPSKWDSLSDADFGDPVNYSYPMPDKEHADNAAARFATPDGLSVYTAKEQDIVAKRIMKAQTTFGEKPDWWPLKDDSGDSGKVSDTPVTRKARDFNTAFQSLAQSDQLQDDWGDTWQAIVTALSDVMYQAYSQVNYPYEGMETIDPVEAAQANLDAFSAAVIDLVKRSVAANFVPMLDNDGDSFLDPDGPNADDDDACYVGSMSADVVADVKAFRERKSDTKAGRTVSAENHAMMSKALDMIGEGHKALSAFVSANDPKNGGDEPPAQSDSVYDPGFGKSQDSRKPSSYHYANARAGAPSRQASATTRAKRAGAPHQASADTTATTHSGRDTSHTTPDDDIARFRALMADMRQSAQQRTAPVAG